MDEQDGSKNKFLDVLLYSELVKDNEFQKRSVLCLADYFSQISKAQLEEISQRLFNSWQKKQNELVSKKLAKVFTNSFSKVKERLLSSFITWKFQASFLHNQDQLSKAKYKLEQVENELKLEQEERLQYQRKLQSRNTALGGEKSYQEHRISFNQEKYESNPIKTIANQIQIPPKDMKGSTLLKFPEDLPTSNFSQDQINHNLTVSQLIQNKPDPKQDPNSTDEDIQEEQMLLNDIKRSLLTRDELKQGLEYYLQEKFQEGLSESLTSAQHRELQHLASLVQKIKSEGEECTFHPKINPKTKQILEQHPAYNIQKSGPLYDRLYKEGKIRQMNQAIMDEIRTTQEMIECTFSPRTNSPSTMEQRVNSSETYKRLHYQELEQRQEKQAKKEAEKLEILNQQYTFKPERLKTKQLDSFLIKSNKENENKYDRLYKDYMQRAEKLEYKRQVKKEHEQNMMSGMGRTSRSKSNKRLYFEAHSALNMISNSFYPQTATARNQRNLGQFPFQSQKALSPHRSGQNHNKIADKLKPYSMMQKPFHKQYSSTIGFSTDLNQRSPPTSSQKKDPFQRLYNQAQISRRNKVSLRETIDKEMGISFSPSVFKSPKKYELSSSKQTVIERNQEFEKNKWQKIQEKEELKYQEYTFEPNLISKQRRQDSISESINSSQQVGQRLYLQALLQEDKKSRKKLQLEHKMKQQYLKKRQ